MLFPVQALVFLCLSKVFIVVIIIIIIIIFAHLNLQEFKCNETIAQNYDILPNLM